VRPGWREFEFPEHSQGAWGIWRPGRGFEVVSDATIDSIIGSWTPQKPLLIAQPESANYAVPVLDSRFGERARRSAQRNLKVLVAIMSLAAIAIVLAGAYATDRQILLLGGCVLLLGMAMAGDLRGAARDPDWLVERATYFVWMYTSSEIRLSLYVWIFIFCAIGLSQLVATALLGGFDEPFHMYGVMYEDTLSGEWWRLISGPYLHYSLAHYITNSVLLTVTGLVCWGMYGRISILLFVLGCSLSLLSQMLYGPQELGNCGGISGGVFALFGATVAGSYLNRLALPRGFGQLLLVMAFIGVLASELTSANAATIAHVSGIILGGLFALACSRFLRQ